MISKDFIRVAKRIAKRAVKLGIMDPLIHLTGERVEIGDGHVLLSVDSPSGLVEPATADAAHLKATHGARIAGRELVQKGEVVACVADTKGVWPDFSPMWGEIEEPTENYLPAFLVDPQKMIDALDAFRKDAPVFIHLPDAQGKPVVIEGSMYDGNDEVVPARALIMAGERPNA